MFGFKSAIATAVTTMCIAATAANAQSAFTYQGVLDDAGVPANGIYDMRFRVFDDLIPGLPDNQIGATFTSPVAVVDGLFAVNLDLGDATFQTDLPRYLQIEVRLNGDPSYTLLTPRHEVVYTPRSFYAAKAGGLDLPMTMVESSATPTLWIENTNDTGTGIRGDGLTAGLLGRGGPSASIGGYSGFPVGTGVVGISDTCGVTGTSNNGFGIRGTSNNGTAAYFRSSTGADTKYAVHGVTAGSTAALFDVDTGWTDPLSNRPALIARTNSSQANAYGVYGIIDNTNAGSFSAGVRGENRGTEGFGIGVYGSHAGTGWGIYGTSAGGFAGWFTGDVQVAGTLSKSGGSFKIDHPQDPENMYLSHSFVESPDMKNIYDGIVTLDQFGQAIVTLPSYFNALNREFRYQLTCIGGYAPVYIASEIYNQQFAIAGGTPGLKVSWQVTGIRHDAWANENRIPTEEYKEPRNQGKYLNPKAFGQPEEKGIGYQPSQQE